MLINLKLFDIDHCLFHSYPEDEKELKNLKKWLIETNQTFLADILKEIEKNKYAKVILGFGTNRQDSNTDRWNSGSGGSAMLVLPILQTYLQKKLSCPVVFDPFLMADIYAKNQVAGTSYLTILEQQLNPAKKINHSEWMFDNTKVSLILTHAHRVATAFPEGKMVIDFYDDSNKILPVIQGFFAEHPDLLPKNITLNIHQYKKDMSVAKPIASIQGIGEIDFFYEWTTRFIATKTYWFSLGANDGYKVYKAEELYNYHDNDKYHDFSKEMRMNGEDIGSKKWKQDLTNFLKSEAPQLANKCTLGNLQYMEAKDLHEKGLVQFHQYDSESDSKIIQNSGNQSLFKQTKETTTSINYMPLVNIDDYTPPVNKEEKTRCCCFPFNLF